MRRVQYSEPLVGVQRIPRDLPPFDPLPVDDCNLFVKYLPSYLDNEGTTLLCGKYVILKASSGI